MRRFLSWIVMILAESVVLFVLNIAVALVRIVMNEIYRLSPILYWAAIIIGGATILGIVFSVIFYGSGIAVKLSQLVWKSKNGLRYKVYGSLCILGYGLTIILSLAKIMTGVDLLLQILFLIASIVFLFVGLEMANSEGGPPTKREILQAKIDKIDAKETEKQQ